MRSSLIVPSTCPRIRAAAALATTALAALVLTLILFLPGHSARASLVVVYADDFNRPPSTNLGNTSFGNFPWQEMTNSTGANNTRFEISGNRLLLQSTSPHNPATAFVDFNLDGFNRYDATFTLFNNTVTGGANNGGAASMFLLPRAEGNDIVGNPGWFLRATSGSVFEVRRYEGTARDGNGSILPGDGVVVGSTINFANGLGHDFLVEVHGNRADLFVNNTFFDTVDLDNAAGNGIPDSFMFGYNQSATSGRNLTMFVDNFAVSVPEPGRTTLSALALLVLLARRRR